MVFFVDLRKYASSFLLIGFVIVFFLLTNFVANTKVFNHDEYESLKKAWSIKQGQSLYKDVADSHGPVYYRLVAGIWNVFDLPDGVATIFIFRHISMLLMLIIVFIIYKIALLFFDKKIALLSVLLLFSNYIFVCKAIEVRPDLLQNVLWFAGLSLMLRKLKGYNANYFIMAILWAIAIFVNIKAIFPIAVAIIFYLIFSKGKDNLKFIGNFFSVFFLGVLILITYLFLSGGIRGYIEHVFINKYFTLGLSEFNVWLKQAFFLFLKSSYFFLILFFAGIIKTWQKSKESSFKYLIFLTLMLFCSTFFIGYFHQWYQIFLPLMAIFAAYGLNDLLSYLEKEINLKEHISLLLIFVYLVIVFFYAPGWDNSILTTNTNKQQVEEINRVLSVTSIKDKVLFFHDKPCGAYVFRPSLFYNWQVPLFIEKDIGKYDDLKKILQEDFYLYLESENCTILNLMDEKFKYFSEKTKKYVYHNYNKIREGLWIKNSINFFWSK